MSAASLPAKNFSKDISKDNPITQIEITTDQARQLGELNQLTRALASPARLAILGTLAGRPGQVVTLEELAAQVGNAAGKLEREVRQLAETGLIEIKEWGSDQPGREPRPHLVVFEAQALQKLQPMIAALSQLTRQLQPAEPTDIMDERTKTVAIFIKNGQLTGWPAQFKRQVYIVEEIAKNFEPEVRYSESQVDDILKQIYEYDHCTLRRYLVDLKFLQRANGEYWKTGGQPS